MKKIFVLLALFLLVNFAFAEDFLAKVSHGALSDTSPGVKKLSLEEMKEVKGGYGLLENSAGNSVFVFQNMNVGTTKLNQIGVVVGLTPYEKDNKVSCGFGGDRCLSLYTNRQAYYDFASIANPDRGEFLAVTATKITVIGLFGIPQVKFSNGGMIVGISGDRIYKIRNATATNKVAQEVLRYVGNDLNRILATQFR